MRLFFYDAFFTFWATVCLIFMQVRDTPLLEMNSAWLFVVLCFIGLDLCQSFVNFSRDINSRRAIGGIVGTIGYILVFFGNFIFGTLLLVSSSCIVISYFYPRLWRNENVGVR